MKLDQLLDPSEISAINAEPGISWVPKNPQEVLLPYIEQQKAELGSTEDRRERAKKVMEGYTKIINKCKSLESEIEQRCKNVSVPLTRSRHLNIIEAISRVFGIDEEQITSITFEMYKVCIQKLAAISNAGVPKP